MISKKDNNSQLNKSESLTPNKMSKPSNEINKSKLQNQSISYIKKMKDTKNSNMSKSVMDLYEKSLSPPCKLHNDDKKDKRGNLLKEKSK